MAKRLTQALVFCILSLMIFLMFDLFAYESGIVVEDAIVGSKYEVTEVDGGEVKRIQHGFIVTKVPFVILDEGTHALTLKVSNWGMLEEDSKPTELMEMTVTVQNGKRYRIEQKDEQPYLRVLER